MCMKQKITLKNLVRWGKVNAGITELLCLMILPAMLQAQTWILPFCSGGPPALTTSNVYGPMYSTGTTNATNRIAIIYPASQLGTIAGSTINNIYFHKATAAALGGSPNFKIYLKQVT